VSDGLGIDVSVAACAAARRRHTAIEVCPLGSRSPAATAADLLGSEESADAPALLLEVAARAMGGDAIGAVVVATGDDTVAQAARATFGVGVVVVPRAVGAAVWWARDSDPAADCLVAVVEADAGGVVTSLVACRPDRFDLLADAAGDHADAVASVVSLVESAGEASRGIDAVAVVGSAPTIDAVADDLAAGLGVPVSLDPEPGLSVALGAALLADDRRGAASTAAVAGGAALASALPFLNSASGPAAVPGAGVGAAVAEGAGGTGGGIGAAAGAATGARRPWIGRTAGKDAPDGTRLRRALRHRRGPSAGKDAPDHSPPADGEGAGGVAPRRRPTHRLGRPLIVVPAVVTVVAMGAGALRSCAPDGDPGGVEAVAVRGGSSAPGTADSDTVPSAPADAGGTAGKVGPRVPGSPPASAGATSSTSGPRPGSPAPTAPRTTVGGAAPSTASPAASPSSPAPAPAAPPPASPPPPPPPDTAGPTISGLARTNADISEASRATCPFPTTTDVSATVTDPSGVASVRVSWQAGSHGGSSAMSLSGGVWRATIGPITRGTMFTDQSVPLWWGVSAVDTLGNSRTGVSGSQTITLHGCIPTVD
jgi:hypothetical protein